MIKTNRESDSKREKLVTEYICNSYLHNAIVCNDKENQLKGIDLINNGLKIDLKAQVSNDYVGNPSKTFILELLALNKLGKKSIGWFLNPKIETDCYGFCWIHKGTAEPFCIKEMEYMLVDKKKLTEYITSSVSKEKLLDIATLMQKNNVNRYEKGPVPGTRYVMSGHLGEKPVNIVVPKEIYKKFSIDHCIITPDKVIKL